MNKARMNSTKHFEHASRQFTHMPEAGVPFEDLLRPDYWAHLAQNHMVRDFIYVAPPENHYTALLMVRSVQKMALKVAVVWRTEFKDVIVEPEKGLTVEFRGAGLWSVMRGKETLANKFATKEEAEAERQRLLDEQKAA